MPTMTQYMSRPSAMLSPLTRDELVNLNLVLRSAYAKLEGTGDASGTQTEISMLRGVEVYPVLRLRP